jgi:hypothetical protein
MWGGKASLPKRERFRTAKTTEIAAMVGQKILFSGRGSNILCSVSAEPAVTKSNNGYTIKAKTHAKIGTIAHLSIIGVEDLPRPNSKECFEALGILAPYGVRVGCPLALNTMGQKGHANLLFAIEQTYRGPRHWSGRRSQFRLHVISHRPDKDLSNSGIGRLRLVA